MLSIKNNQQLFDGLLLKSLDETLRDTLGENSIKKTICEDLFLETIYSKLDLCVEWKKGYKFLDYIEEL
ncbi:hypothetical protein KAI11_03450 [Candidatus Bathyarchaeota archaeon]|nr:hypothetical protein [Candidatus Bathyarchaeota archaeon]